jgi:hypothetical protein
MGHHPIAEEGVDAVPGAVKELVGNYEIKRPVLLLERSHGRHRHYALNAKLFKSIYIGAKVQLTRQDMMSPPVTREKGHSMALEATQHVSIRGRAKGGRLRDLLHPAQTGHRVKPAATDDADFCLRQKSP